MSYSYEPTRPVASRASQLPPNSPVGTPVLPTPTPKPPTRVTTTDTSTGGGGNGGIVFIIGLSLLVASGWTSGLLKDVFHIFGTKSQMGTPKMHQNLLWFFGEFLFVMILTAIADVSSEASKAVIALLLVLWLVFVTDNNIRVTGWLGALTPGMK
jgi:hypothetical protein